jgi:asparagine synthase (glutamine-hydrolysing)
MFALALWDHARQRLYLARDRFGIKPLFLFENAHCLAFASEAKALLALPFVPRDVDPLAIKEYLTLQHTLASRSVFRGIRRLEPARLLRVSREGISEREYWQLSYADQGNGIPGSAREAVRAALTESVTGHLVSDVPVGALLSGGLDTSAIVAVASPLYPGTLHTYTACSEPEPRNSDRLYANEVAVHFGTAHHPVWLTPEGFADAFPHVIWHLDEPGGGVPAVAAFYLARAARQHVRVILSGEGSDEAFGGYLHHLRAFAEARLADGGGMPLRLLRGLQLLPHLSAYRTELGGRREAFASLRAGLSQERWWESFRRPHFARLSQPPLGARLAAEASGYEPLHEINSRFISAAHTNEPVNKLQWLDLRTYLVTILQIYDRMCMAASIEARVPFLDHPLVELAASIPAAHRLRGLRTKQLLRDAVAPLLPSNVVQRRKSGFQVPFGAWLRGPLRDWARDQLSERVLREQGLVDATVARSTLERHAAGEDQAKEIWTLLSLEAWRRTFLEGARPAGPCACVARPRPALATTP